MSSCRQQALIDAPLEAVWELVGDPRRMPEWAGRDVEEVYGLASVDLGATYRQTTRTPFGKNTTTFEIEALDELREIRLRCQTSGYYSHWRLTEAQDATFAEVEIGMEPTGLAAHAINVTLGKRWYRRLLENALDGVRSAARRERADRPG